MAARQRTLDVILFGGFQAVIGGKDVPREAWQQRRAKDLVKLLALAPRRRLHRELVISALWPELDATAGAANLRKAVHYARRALDFEEGVSVEDGVVTLAPDAAVSVDVDRFEHEALAALRTGNQTDAAHAASLHTGPLLPEDTYEPWLEDARDRVRRRYLQILRAARLWELVVEAEPVDEPAHRALIAADLSAGNRQGALRRFEQLKEILQRELGVGPDEQSLELYRQALGSGADAPATPAERVGSLVASAVMLMHRGELDKAERAASSARDLATEAGLLGRALGEASAIKGLVAHMRGRWREVFLSEFLDAVKRPPALGSGVFDAHLCLAEYWLGGPDGIERGETFARELLELAEKNGSLHGRGVATLILGEAALIAGRLDDAETHIGAAVALHQEAGAMSGWALSLGRLAEIALARGDHARTTRILTRARTIAAKAPLAPHLVVRLLGTGVEAARTRAERARLVREAEEALAGQEVCDPCSSSFRAACATACASSGDIEAANSYAEATHRIAGMWQSGAARASEWEARAAIRQAEGNWTQAAALLHEAADLYAKSGHARAAARCRTVAETRPAPVGEDEARGGEPV